MTVTPITPAQTEDPAKLAEIPAVGSEELERLSEAACPGPWNARLVFEVTPEDSDFCDALVNAYRAGELVPAFAAANPSGGWRPIETAPKDGTPVLVGWADFPWQATQAHYEDGIWGQLTSDFGFDPLRGLPTHWQPLPAPPGALGTEARSAEVKND